MGKLIGVIVVVLVLVVGIVVWMNQGKESGGNQTATTESTAETNMEAPSENMGVVASIKDAMGLGQEMQCTYSSDMNGQTFTSTVAIDGEKFKAISEVSGMTTYALYDGATQYMWTSGSKQGFKMDKACLDEMKAKAGDMMQSSGSSDMKMEDMRESFDMAKNVSCKPATSIDLAVPADVTFTDQCAMMKQSMEMMEKMKSQMPQGMTMPSGMPAAQ